MNQKSLFIGVGVTIVWFLGITIFCIWGNFGFEKNDLNSLGDFLAGVFAPVAFFWLILGYVQQGKQLDQNTKALEQQERALQLQIEEMREGVRQQAELANIQKENLEIVRKQSQPQLSLFVCEIKDYLRTLSDDGSLSSCEISVVEVWFRIENFGAEAKNVSLIDISGHRIGSIDFIEGKTSKKMPVTLSESEISNIKNNEKLSKEVNLVFLDRNSFEYYEAYVLEVWSFSKDKKLYASIKKSSLPN